MVIGFGNSTVSRLRTILEDLNLTLNMAKSGALANSSWYCTYSCAYCSIRDLIQGLLYELQYSNSTHRVLVRSETSQVCLDEDSLAGGGDAGKGKHSAFTRRAFFNQLPRSTAGFAPVKTSAMESLKHPTL